MPSACLLLFSYIGLIWFMLREQGPPPGAGLTHVELCEPYWILTEKEARITERMTGPGSRGTPPFRVWPDLFSSRRSGTGERVLGRLADEWGLKFCCPVFERCGIYKV